MEPRQCGIPSPRSPPDRCFERSFRGRTLCGQAQVEFTAPACDGFLECDIPKTRNVRFWPLAGTHFSQQMLGVRQLRVDLCLVVLLGRALSSVVAVVAASPRRKKASSRLLRHGIKTFSAFF